MALMTEVSCASLNIQTPTRPIFEHVWILTAQEMTVAEVIEEKEGSNIQLGTPEPFSGQCLEVEQGLRSVYTEKKRVFFSFFIKRDVFFSMAIKNIIPVEPLPTQGLAGMEEVSTKIYQLAHQSLTTDHYHDHDQQNIN